MYLECFTFSNPTPLDLQLMGNLKLSEESRKWVIYYALVPSSLVYTKIPNGARQWNKHVDDEPSPQNHADRSNKARLRDGDK